MIAAGIVLYNPDIERFHMCLNSIRNQVDKIYVFNNGNQLDNKEFKDVTFLSEGINKGIPYALNTIASIAEKEGCDWLLTMDQDSILPEGMIDDFKNYTNEKDVGIICPQVIDKRRSYLTAIKSQEVKELDMCITSASLTSISAWKEIGGFDEWLFIDLVDNEFCKRLRVSGYKILQLQNWILDQEFGDIEPKSKWKQDFWINVSKVLHSQNFAKFSYKKHVNPMRVYYTCRNIIYVNCKLKKYGKTGYENYHCKGYFGFIFCFILPSILRSEKKKETFNAIVAGCRDGRNAKVDAWTANKVLIN